MNDPLHGVPISLRGDNVYLFNVPTVTDLLGEQMKVLSRRIAISRHRYRCPFSLIDEFGNWFEWQERRHVRKQSSGDAAAAMAEAIGDDRLEACKLTPRPLFRVRASWLPTKPRAIFITSVV